MQAAICNTSIERYFSELNARMADLSAGEREEFVRELRAHVLDRLQQVAEPTDGQCQAVLAALGTPEEIARQYRLEMILNRAAKSRSPLVLLRGTLRWALTGVQGFMVFIVAIVGYMTSVSFYACALMKSFFPDNVGFYVSKHGLNLAQFPHQYGHEVLQTWFIPITLVLGLLLMQGTTMLLKFLIWHFRKLKQRI
ncbi:MAG TPA: hypothetical protein VI636_17575 [Candidatus Angelobacter sp.]